jgi:hypothetical protein
VVPVLQLIEIGLYVFWDLGHITNYYYRNNLNKLGPMWTVPTFLPTAQESLASAPSCSLTSKPTTSAFHSITSRLLENIIH